MDHKNKKKSTKSKLTKTTFILKNKVDLQFQVKMYLKKFSINDNWNPIGIADHKACDQRSDTVKNIDGFY